MDIIAAIDAATGCQHCGGDLGNSPSSDFCCEACQTAWAAARTTPLVGYREPYAFSYEDYAAFPPRWMLGVDGVPGAPPVAVAISHRDLVATPRSELDALAAGRVYVADVDTPYEADGNGGWREIGTITDEPVFTNTTPADTDTRAVLLRRMGLAHIDPESMRAQLAPLVAHFEAIEHPRSLPEITFEAVQFNWDAVRHYYFSDEPEQPSEPDGPTDPRARALWLRQHRNTGPTRQRRTPRAINPRRAR